ncbi:mediator of RNA polymerase II transcription subunit 6 isoform X2 [Carica papaya]|uniref:mediator of RNA polymerase II transcription subunit 6 isoform X2 n=1 Tax=Carica papaya TaxID=3649 RepID=UPI000B8C8F12|nr:mediator of RNA polymerase II transcription subunit 6 isoform X2 [Carica papaya]
MATPPVAPPIPPAGVGNFEGNLAGPPQPGTDMTGICFRDQLWLNTYPLDRNLIFDYFALSPFYDWTCNNEQLRMRSIHPLDPSHLSEGLFIMYLRLSTQLPQSWKRLDMLMLKVRQTLLKQRLVKK